MIHGYFFPVNAREKVREKPMIHGYFPTTHRSGEIGKEKPLYYVKGKRPSGVGLLPLHYVPRISLSLVRDFDLSQTRSIATSKGGVLRCQPKSSTTSGRTAGTTEGRKANAMQYLDPLQATNLDSMTSAEKANSVGIADRLGKADRGKAMKERPILFSSPMIRAILDGRKTMTRRVVKPQPYIVDHGNFTAWRWDHGPGDAYTTWKTTFWKTTLDPLTFVGMACERRPWPYGSSGDRLWVRETWRCHQEESGLFAVNYRADDSVVEWGPFDAEPAGFGMCDWTWKPSIHMPRWASRITLEVTAVRVERLQEIDEADAEKEGVGLVFVGCRPMFRRLWNELNESRGFGWDTNPWVWVISFERLKP